MNPHIVTDQSDKSGQAVVAWILTVVTCGYMLPWAIAASRGKSNAGAVGVITLLAGWTFIGWIIAMVMACGPHQVAGYAQPVYQAPYPVQGYRPPAPYPSGTHQPLPQPQAYPPPPASLPGPVGDTAPIQSAAEPPLRDRDV